MFGVAVTDLFNIFVVYGLFFVGKPSHKHISYILFCNGSAATIAPYASSLIIELFDSIGMALYVGSGLYGLTILLMVFYKLHRTEVAKLNWLNKD